MTLKDEELKGKRFGRLTLLHRIGKDKWNDPIFRFKCDCGVEKDILWGSVRKGYTKSCGCLNSDNTVKRNIESATHRMSGTYEYKIWSGLKNRCYCETSKDYKNYGARGIKVCDRWLNSFENFYEDMGERPSIDYSIERKDVNGDYKPSNCCWILKDKQALNKRNSLYITYKGETKVLSEWAVILNIKSDTLYKRIYKYNWSVEKAFTMNTKDYHKGKTERISSKTKFIECFGISWPLRVWAKMVGIKAETITARIKRGWSPEKAIITPIGTN